ncbi:hydrogenase formation protein HypD [Candidatus Uabimicrobium amorphum]|uniref:Hydrogenase formation protein HypD n=1 Tax=Uabimicrobium amorphum TaxID=2596890 RepID=A0A5S9IXC3_UABAM|nr:hydrogenase formation protein HypD [Candidatus Uabimicrobium amorphum]BBM88255.1 hydrogenase formation protein HypD [Candidatus Uabimicrobium amorphum]
MKYIDEYRKREIALKYSEEIQRITRGNWTIMEVCGGQTHAIVKFGIDHLLPSNITLLHGPGCPVCVTPIEIIDVALQIAALPEVIFCSFGDMLRVPGSREDLLAIKAQGGDVRIVYSPLDALEMAKKYRDKQVVFFAIGFETTAPANAMAVYQAHRQNIENFSLLVSHVLVPPAMKAILDAQESNVDGFLAAGHVCTVMGYEEYEDIAQNYEVPIVVTGFEPVDILQGIYMCILQLEKRQHKVENQYSRVVKREGNTTAQKLMEEVFAVVPQKWRGMDVIAQSGFDLRGKYQTFCARRRFAVEEITVQESTPCISGEILRGVKKPCDCPLFAKQCSPENPLGATMVSSEGACAAYYQYRH